MSAKSVSRSKLDTFLTGFQFQPRKAERSQSHITVITNAFIKHAFLTNLIDLHTSTAEKLQFSTRARTTTQDLSSNSYIAYPSFHEDVVLVGRVVMNVRVRIHEGFGRLKGSGHR